MSEITAGTPQLLRRVNAEAILLVMRSTTAVTVTELIEATGLTRATVIAVCEDLEQRGWVRELPNQRDFGGYQKGRPARRFELNERAGYVLGVDVGVAKTTVVVADLRGTLQGRASQPFRSAEIPATERIEVIDRTAIAALEDAGASPQDVMSVCVGIAAPVDRKGDVLVTQSFWGKFDVGLRSALTDLHGWNVLLENDANLAALGERWRGSAVGIDDVVVILASERFGSGVIEDGRLLRGSGGGFGEMAYLDLVEGVGDPFGIASLARRWAAEALASPAKTTLRPSAPGTEVEAEDVFAAAAAGDAVALAILDRLSDRVARVVATVSTMVNPELVVIGGGVAKSAGVLLESVAERLPQLTATPPRLAASPLGDAIVTVGAVRRALDHVEANWLEMEPAAAS
ncbi:ROK family transcriptional regulator [Arthrobacter rhizosphaerae]|uniref:ROK family transcriptional regulator n=1 Tax=Arthrobacter rhizosphaerae TaxID=2855490 RepID=UPI001FF1B8C0|nr:ROK family transcriptional regulator [Arthrobacter rhizosphaerae]